MSLSELPLPEGFALASDLASGDTLKGKFSNDEMLLLYAYYKMVKVGENKARVPKNMFSPTEVKKHYAWKKLGQLVQSKLDV